MTGGRLTYLLGASLLTGLYGFGEAVGWEPKEPVHRETIAPHVRQSPGGWRAWTFWHQGLHGGK